MTAPRHHGGGIWPGDDEIGGCGREGDLGRGIVLRLPNPSDHCKSYVMNEPAAPPPLRPFAERLIDTLLHRIGKDERAAKPHDWLAATILTLRDQIIDRWMESTRAMHATGAKRVYYLSLEFLIGRLLRDALSNLGMAEEVQAALTPYGIDLAKIEE